MAAPLRKQSNPRTYGSYNHKVVPSHGSKYVNNIKPAAQIRRKRKSAKKANPFTFLFQLMFAVVFCLYVSPVYVDQITRPVFLRAQKYPNVVVDYQLLYSPTSAYLHNNHMLGVNLLSGTEIQKPKMQKLYETIHLSTLEDNLNFLASHYPKLKPSVYVWDYESGKFADVKADEVYSTASIIKIPVLIQLFKAVENGTVSLDDKIAMTDYYISEGSGSLQFKGVNKSYTVDDLARVMITESDNSATNVLLDVTGGMNAMNQSFRKWGLRETRINDWLPDLEGTNVSTSREMATMLFNLDSPTFFNLISREKMIDYMSHVHNNRLIQAGLPSNAIFIHKTGDIGKMLGDAGIVYTASGKKYIVVMFVNRPFNSPDGKDFIVQASTMIYNYIENTSL